MKIVCDSCGAKYSIADEKVQGKVFKIRCKKCSNVIVVKGTAEAEASAADDSLGASAGAAEWYVVIDGEQVGPVTTVEIDSYFMSGKINTETYAWKDGMGDWMHIVEIPEFAHLGSDMAGPNEATQIADSGHRYDAGETDATNVVQSPLAMHDGGGTGGDDYGSDPGYGDDDYGYAAAGDDDEGYSGFASGYDSGGGIAGLGGDLAAAGGDDDAGAGMFAAFDTGSDSDFMSFGDDPAPASNGANGSNGSNGSPAPVSADMVGQRNENSVLFSLSSLDSVPAVNESKSDAPVTEGSGLIDIQALASAHKSMSGTGEADAGGGIDPFAQGTMAMPALMPMGSHRSNNTLYIALAVGGVAVLALLAMGGYMIFGEKEKPKEQEVKIVERVIEKVVPAEGSPSNNEEIAKEAEEAAKAIEDAEPKKPEGEEGEEEDEKDSKPAAAKKRDRRTKRNSSTKKDDPDPEPAPKPTKKKDGIDSLLDKIDKKGKSAPAPEASSSKKSLSRNDVKQTINRYNSRINTCARSQNKSGKKGTVKVKFYIRPNGRVRGAQVVSSGFRGTDVGSCVQKVVGSMTFPKTAASKDVPVTYPFILK